MRTKIRAAVVAAATTVGLVAATAGPAAADITLANHSRPRWSPVPVVPTSRLNLRG